MPGPQAMYCAVKGLYRSECLHRLCNLTLGPDEQQNKKDKKIKKTINI